MTGFQPVIAPKRVKTWDVVSPPNDSVPEAALTQCLRELPDYVVLRNEEDLFGNLQRGGDIDLLVADLGLAERT